MVLEEVNSSQWVTVNHKQKCKQGVEKKGKSRERSKWREWEGIFKRWESVRNFDWKRRVGGIGEAKGMRGTREWDGICQKSDRIRGGAQARNFRAFHTAEMRVVQVVLCKEEQGLENLRGQDCRYCRWDWNIEVARLWSGQNWRKGRGEKAFLVKIIGLVVVFVFVPEASGCTHWRCTRAKREQDGPYSDGKRKEWVM